MAPRRSASNPWSAFADLLFMLFLTTLMSALIITNWAVQAEDRLKGCGASQRFMDSFAACVGAPAQESDNACKVSLGEERLRFAEGSASLGGTYAAFGHVVASCLVKHLETAVGEPEQYQAIDVVTIDGYTDCVGGDAMNLFLGAERAATLFGYVTEELDAPRYQSDLELRSRILGKIAVRSFGRNRPHPDSPCGQDPVNQGFAGFAIDRRVEVSVQSRLRTN